MIRDLGRRVNLFRNWEIRKNKSRNKGDNRKKKYKRRLWLVLWSRWNGKNKISTVNPWAAVIFRYEVSIIQWKENELKGMDRITRKMMTMNGALHPKSDVDRLYVKRKK